LNALEAEQADPGFWANQDRARQLVQEMKALKSWVAPADEITRRLQDARGLSELIEAEPDEVMAAELERELGAIEADLRAYELKSMLQGPEDRPAALLTIHPGAGGRGAARQPGLVGGAAHPHSHRDRRLLPAGAQPAQEQRDRHEDAACGALSAAAGGAGGGASQGGGH